DTYHYVEVCLLDDFVSERQHPALSDDYENPFGDGFDIEDFDHEDIGVEGEDDLDSGSDGAESEDGPDGEDGSGDEFNNGNGVNEGQENFNESYNEPAGDP